MKLLPLDIAGAYLVQPEPIADERGCFARTWCLDAAAKLGLETAVAQCSISYNAKRGTLRGMHFQAPPFEEVKLVRCTQGAVYDVIVDLRPQSPTYLKWTAQDLTAGNRLAVYIPQGVAHGFQTLEDGAELAYQISQPYHPELARGVRWDDPAFGIRWPDAERILSERDRTFPDFSL